VDSLIHPETVISLLMQFLETESRNTINNSTLSDTLLHTDTKLRVLFILIHRPLIFTRVV